MLASLSTQASGAHAEGVMRLDLEGARVVGDGAVEVPELVKRKTATQQDNNTSA